MKRNIFSSACLWRLCVQLLALRCLCWWLSDMAIPYCLSGWWRAVLPSFLLGLGCICPFSNRGCQQNLAHLQTCRERKPSQSVLITKVITNPYRQWERLKISKYCKGESCRGTETLTVPLLIGWWTGVCCCCCSFLQPVSFRWLSWLCSSHLQDSVETLNFLRHLTAQWTAC